MDRHQKKKKQRHEEPAVTGGGEGERRASSGGAMSASRRGRFDHLDDGVGVATVPVVDQADCTARSCVAVTLADAIALGCCPCAVFSLLGLAFVKAPLAVARRCLRRLRRRRGEMRHKKRVMQDDDDTDTVVKCRRQRRRGAHDDEADAWKGGGEVGPDSTPPMGAAGRRSSSCASSGRLDAEKVWMEMYRVGQWGFGRLSVSVTPPRQSHVRTAGGQVAAARCSDGDGAATATRGRKDAVLRCES